MKKCIFLLILLFNITIHPVYAVEDHEFIELCATGTIQQIQSAINAGCDVNIATDENGWTPLIMAASMNPDKKVVDALIKAGADVSHKDGNGETALFFAARRTSNPEIIVSLLRAGADPSVKNAKGNLPVEYAIENPKLKGSSALRQLLDASPKIGKRKRVLDDWEFVELCKTGAPTDVQSAIQAGANVNAVDDENSWTTLMWAAKENPNVQVITILAKAGANVNEKDENDLTPLMLAATHNPNPDVVASLLRSGADAKVRNLEGKRAIDFASENKKLQGSEAYQKLLAMDPKANQARNNGRYSSSFIDLCKRGTPEEILNAIKAGADVNAKHPSGMTPLMFAAWQNSDARVIDVLLKAGAETNARTLSGATALIVAASDNPNPEVVIALLRAGADATVMDDKGKRAIDYAQSNKLLVGTAAFKMLEKASK